jgi:D-tyrosyl-tRNA(Tyr) deacylase
MRALLQRVSSASVSVGGELVGEIGAGILALVGVTHSDDLSGAHGLATRTWNLRMFDDDAGKMNLPVAAVGGAVLVVSQFTLYGDARRGRRPSWVGAAPPEVAEPLVDAYTAALADLGARVETGRFGEHMDVSLVNDGPVTLLLEA